MLRPWKLQIKIDFKVETPIYIQIVNAIIEAIKSGKLQYGTALPGSRKLAELLNVNRNTVVKALGILTVEGWLISKQRKGVFVASDIPEIGSKTKVLNPSKYYKKEQTPLEIIFDDGIPDSKMAPMEELSRAYRRVFNQKSKWKLMGYYNELGTLEFREAIAQMLSFKRGLNIATDHVAITRGSQMAMYLAAQVLFSKGDAVIVENPGYIPAWKVFEKAGATVIPVQTDNEGIRIDEIETILNNNLNVKAVFVTPHHQYPTTVTMSLVRRLKLIDLSNTFGFTIIEDDYDHEFHFEQRPVLPISSHKEIQNYIYIGSMSKVVTPALRMGYLVSNTDFINKISDLRKIIDVQGDIIMELAVLDLIRSGDIRRHLKRATSHYRKKRAYFKQLLETHLADKVTFEVPKGGLAFWIKPNKKVNNKKFHESLLKRNVDIITTNNFGNKSNKNISGLRIGYASLSSEKLKKGLIEIGKLL
ncbi:GntR family transcriptional regulator/MocR family aminotransferase [Aquimarina sp. MAR_2010_214]|uniref:MocR-like pyridoxine biosynthesis transcription factor PdxR n=1 Tax=Aquimarina sp. MAR_2010_214 TaxID=1250026 RepID=UPI000C70B4D5|nr:PLP-dependent aminotransferase family protein [Aquimarina sp. MAR_2010_214]PKV52574.1 GntR family transcriptional regulator/MocR family aminotransferase [Aquimarina sp. MAR_2010_214]